MQGVNATQTNVSIAPFRAECSSMLEGRGGERRGREGKARQGKARQGKARQGKARQTREGKTREGFRVREAELEFLAL